LSLKVGYCIFYVSFIVLLLFFSAEMGPTIITGITQETIEALPTAPPEAGLWGLATFLLDVAIYGFNNFGFLVAISTPYTILFGFVILPLSVGFLWALLELARGN